jgi:hypothetical protein
MKYIALIIAPLYCLVVCSAFAPPASQNRLLHRAAGPSPSCSQQPFLVKQGSAPRRPTPTPATPRSLQGRTSLQMGSFFSDLFEAIESMPPNFDLAFGIFVIFCAVTPYTLGLFFPTFLFKSFFLPIYGDNDEAGRNAEIYWKLMYATLGLVLSTITFTEAILDNGTQQALRDTYVAWALFYIGAIIKIRYEAGGGIIKVNRVGIQVWHSIVVISMLVSIGLRPEVVSTVKSAVL